MKMNTMNAFRGWCMAVLLPVAVLPAELSAFDAASLRHRADKLVAEAEQLRGTQPDFADWVKAQRKIFANFERAAEYDRACRPERLEQTVDDWTNLLTRMEAELEIFRTLPDPGANGVINARDFGVKGDGVTDDLPALRRLFEQAAAGTVRTVFLPAGCYRLDNRQSLPVFSLSAVKDFRIAGEAGTVLKTDIPRGPIFKVEGCSNLRLENFHVTSAEGFLASGEVVEAAPDHVDIVLDRGSLEPTHPAFKRSDGRGLIRFFSGHLLGGDRTPQEYLSTGPVGFLNCRVERLDDGKFRFHIPGKQVRVGSRLAYIARDHRAAFTLSDSHHCRLDRISLDTFAGLTISPDRCDALFITGCSTRAAASSPVALATAADACMGRGGTLGGYMARNHFSNHGDDFVNLYSWMRPAHLQDGNRIYVEESFSPGQLKHIKRVNLIRYSAGETFIRENIRVKSVSRVVMTQGADHVDVKKSRPGAVVRVTTAPQPIPMLCLELEHAPSFDLKTTAPIFEMGEVHVLRAYAKEKFDMVQFPDFDSQGQVITGNSFTDGVSRLLHVGSASLLENNYFRNRLPIFTFGRAASWNEFVPWWAEANYPRYITIDGNVIDTPDCRIFNMADTCYDPSDWKTWSAHCFIENNVIRFSAFPGHAGQPAFWIRGIDDIVVRGNYLSSTLERGAQYRLENCRAVIGGNTFCGRFAPPEILGNAEVIEP